jgi:alanine racemase
VVGVVSMDSFAVALDRRMPLGAEVTIVGRGVTLEKHARVAGSINYELATRVNAAATRASRAVVDG